MNDVAPSSVGLRRFELLGGLAQDELDDLARRCAWRAHRTGQCIVAKDSRERSVYLVVAGCVRVTTYSREGRQTTFRDVRAGDYFGDLSAIDGGPRSADVFAIEPTLLASMSPDVFWGLLREKPGMAAFALQRMSGLVRSLSERVVDMSTLDVRGRLNAEILRLAQAGKTEGNRAIIDPAPKHMDLASKISTAREEITRGISALTRSGLLARHGSAWVINDVTGLAQLVQRASPASRGSLS